MIKKLINYLHQLRSFQRINMALSRGAATSALRSIDLSNPDTWEFSGFSQSGEDGIIDVLSRNIKHPNRYFVEIGASDGLENNTTWLAMARRWSGLWVEGDAKTSEWSAWIFSALNYGLETACMFVDKENVGDLAKRSLHLDPDLFSLDIDGNDYYLAKVILASGFKPKIFVVEYNSAFGPSRSVTIPYSSTFRRGNQVGDDLYYGCSVSAWKHLFARFGYEFITVDLNGVNAFFIKSGEFETGFVDGVRGTHFRENFAQFRQYKSPWGAQFALMQCRELVFVEGGDDQRELSLP